MIPDLLYFLLAGGALSAAFIPVFTEYLSKEEEKVAWKVASTIANLLIILTIAGVLLEEIFAPYLVSLLAFGFKGETFKLCVLLTRIMVPMVIFTALSALCTGILHSYKHFLAPAIAYIFYDIPIILATFILGYRFGIIGVSLGVLIGALGLVLVQLPAIYRRGWYYQFILDLSHPGVKKIIKLFVPAMLGLAISQINLFIIPKVFSTRFSPGIVTYLEYTIRIVMLPFGIFAMAISQAVFPTLVTHLSENKITNFRSTFSQGINSIFFFSFPSTAGLMLLSFPIIYLLYYGGKFTISDVQNASYILSFFALAVIGLSGIQVIARGFYAHQNTLTPMKIGLFCLFVNIILCIILPRTSLSFKGLPLAVSTTSILNFVILGVVFQKRYKMIDLKLITISFLKITTASLIMGIIILLISPYIQIIFKGENLLSYGVRLGALMIIGAVVYVLSATLLKIEEMKKLVQIFKRKG